MFLRSNLRSKFFLFVHFLYILLRLLKREVKSVTMALMEMNCADTLMSGLCPLMEFVCAEWRLWETIYICFSVAVQAGSQRQPRHNSRRSAVWRSLKRRGSRTRSNSRGTKVHHKETVFFFFWHIWISKHFVIFEVAPVDPNLGNKWLILLCKSNFTRDIRRNFSKVFWNSSMKVWTTLHAEFLVLLDVWGFSCMCSF